MKKNCAKIAGEIKIKFQFGPSYFNINLAASTAVSQLI